MIRFILSISLMLLFTSITYAQTAHTYSPANLAQTTVTLRGHVDPGAGGTFYGVEFEIADNSSFTGSTTHGPIEGSNYTSASNISFNATGLTANTTYFYRVKVGYSTLTGGGITATSVNFTTLSASNPTVNIGSDFSSITSNSANNTNNEVTADGGSNVSECGLVIATHTTPSTSDTKINITSGLGTYNGSLTSLNQLTKYYVRAYAINTHGTGYSSVTKNFNTLASTNSSIDSMVSHASGELTIYYQTGSGDACIIYMRDGSSITNNPANGTAYSGSTTFGSGNDLGNNTYVVLAATNAKANSVTVTGLNDDHNYYVKSGAYDDAGKNYDVSSGQLNTNDDSNLPMDLIYFAGKKENKGIRLVWTTASEVNNEYFTIERSTDNSSYSSIARIEGAGNSNTILNYTFIDNNIDKTNYYYRIKQTDYDGDFSYSHSIFINNSSDNTDLTILNTANNLVLSISNNTGNGIMRIISINGQVLKTISINQEENKSISINKNQFSKGIYIIQYTNGFDNFIKKVVLQALKIILVFVVLKLVNIIGF